MSESGKAVFLSYASQDAEAAKKICDALRAADVVVWFDQSELVGGDAWDAKIRGQIASCDLFVPLISANTQARLEGYFRLEWKLAAQRTHTMADEKAFLLPVVIDAARDAEAKVPAEFKAVQWTRLRLAYGGQARPEDEDPALARFVARVQKLLGGEAGGRDFSIPASAPEVKFGDPARQTPARGRIAWIIGGVATLILAGALGQRYLQRGSPPTALTSNLEPKTSNPAPLSEARKLAAKARELTEADASIGNPTRDDLALAESFCKQAVALDQNDADVWATYSLVNSQYFRGNIDPSPERRELARTQVERALKLAPTSFEARYAKANYLRGLDGQSLVEAESLLRELMAERPGEGRVLISLGKVVWGALGSGRNLARADEALALFDRAAAVSAEKRAEALGQRAWLLFNLGRYAGAEASFDEAMRDRPTAAHLGLRVVLLSARGDLAKGRAMLAQIPDSVLQTDQGVGVAAPFWLIAREPAKCLALLNAVSRDYISSNTYIGTVDGLRGDAYQLAGRAEAARNARQTALRVIERRLADQPRDAALLGERAKILVQLGERDAATQGLRLFEEIYPDPRMPLTSTHHLVAHVLIDPPEQAIARLESSAWTAGLIGQMRLNFNFDALRGNARFEALLGKGGTDANITPAKADDKSVAVLPFANLSGDKEQEYFSDGLTEEILNALARERDLRVPGRTSSFSFKGKAAPVVEIAQALNVSRLVEGSVRKSGGKVRISVSLTRAADGFTEELGTFTEELTDIFALQDKVARAVVEKLTRRTVTAGTVGLTKNPAAYDAYLRGRALQIKAANYAPEAAKLFEQAVALDPEFALAWVRLAQARFRSYTDESTPELAAAVRESIDRALAVQPDLPEALIARANWTRVVQGDNAAARRDLARAEALAPPSAELRNVQVSLARSEDNWPEVFRLQRESLSLDPQNGDTANAIGISYAMRGDWPEADRLYTQARAIQGPQQDTPVMNQVWVRVSWRGPESALRLIDRLPADQAGADLSRIGTLALLGRTQEARAIIDRLEGAGGGTLTQSIRATRQRAFLHGTYLRITGHAGLARRWAEAMRADVEREFARGNRSGVVQANGVAALIMLGRTDDALRELAAWRQQLQGVFAYRFNRDFSRFALRLYATLGRADEVVALWREIEASGLHLEDMPRYDPDYAPVRSDPRIQELIKKQEAWAAAQPDPVDL